MFYLHKEQCREVYWQDKKKKERKTLVFALSTVTF